MGGAAHIHIIKTNKEFIVDVWESRKLRLYGESPKPNSSGWDLGQDGKLWNGRNGRSGKLSHSNDVIGACNY